jgi:hypothetical protein
MGESLAGPVRFNFRLRLENLFLSFAQEWSVILPDVGVEFTPPSLLGSQSGSVPLFAACCGPICSGGLILSRITLSDLPYQM